MAVHRISDWQSFNLPEQKPVENGEQLICLNGLEQVVQHTDTVIVQFVALIATNSNIHADAPLFCTQLSIVILPYPPLSSLSDCISGRICRSATSCSDFPILPQVSIHIASCSAHNTPRSSRVWSSSRCLHANGVGDLGKAQMVKKMCPERTKKYERETHIAVGHLQTVQYIAAISI